MLAWALPHPRRRSLARAGASGGAAGIAHSVPRRGVRGRRRGAAARSSLALRFRHSGARRGDGIAAQLTGCVGCAMCPLAQRAGSV